MRYFLVTLLIVVLAGCGTTMPRSTDTNQTTLEAEDSSIGSAIGAAAGGLLGYLTYMDSALIVAMSKAIAFRPPTRKYVGIPSRELYDYAVTNLKEKKFEIVRSDSDIGTVHAKLEKGVVKQFLFWRWEQAYYVTYEFRTELDEINKVRLYYSFWVEESPPLSSEYVHIESDENAKMIDVNLLSTIDEYVKNKGGRY